MGSKSSFKYNLFYRTSIVPSKYVMTIMIIIMMISFYIFARHVSPFVFFDPWPSQNS